MLSKTNKENKVLIIIPALNPEKEFIVYVKKLIKNGFSDILIINDGSEEECNNIFETLKKEKHCTVMTHDKNEGKGKAIKDGLKYFLQLKNIDEFSGVITVDCDGQHLIKDIKNIAQSMNNNQNELILGVRDFSKDNVPSKSSFGNKLTSKVLKFLYGKKISDTQTGLRGIPTKLVEQLINLPGNRYEYETNMLIDCILKKIDILEIPIETVYIDNNSNTHFRPVVDSISIYFRIFNSFLKYSAVSIVSFIIDIGLFKVFFNVLEGFINNSLILISTILARIISSFINFILNKKFSFNSNKKLKSTVLKYYALCVIQMIASGILVSLFYNLLGVSEVIIKILVDTILFFINYRVQRLWIFNE